MYVSSLRVLLLEFKKLFIIGADDVVRRRRYCDHFVTVCVGVCMVMYRVYVSIMKQNSLIAMT